MGNVENQQNMFFFKDAEKQVNDFFQPTFFWSPKSMLTKLGKPHVEPAYRMVLCVCVRQYVMVLYLVT